MKKISEVRNKKGELYFERFLITENNDYEVLLHKIYRADEDPHLHNHSWWFRSMIIKGGYVERKLNLYNKEVLIERINGDSYEMFKGEYHKIDRLINNGLEPVETIVMRIKTDEDTWGYLVDGKHVPHSQYRKQKNEER